MYNAEWVYQSYRQCYKSDKVLVVLVISGAYESHEAAQRIVKLQYILRTTCYQIQPA